MTKPEPATEPKPPLRYECELVLYSDGIEPVDHLVTRINHYLAISRDRYLRHPHRRELRAEAAVHLRYGHPDG